MIWCEKGNASSWTKGRVRELVNSLVNSLFPFLLIYFILFQYSSFGFCHSEGLKCAVVIKTTIYKHEETEDFCVDLKRLYCLFLLYNIY